MRSGPVPGSIRRRIDLAEPIENVAGLCESGTPRTVRIAINSDRFHTMKLNGAATLIIQPTANLSASIPKRGVVDEVAAERGCPGKRPLHPLLERLQLRERCPRHRHQGDVVVCQMDDGAIEPSAIAEQDGHPAV